MENRDRDKMSKNVNSTSGGDVNRSTSSNLDKSKGDSQSNFGKNIGRTEDISNEPSRRSGSVDSSGMQGSSSSSSSSSGTSRSGNLNSSQGVSERDDSGIGSSGSSSRGENTGSRH